MWTFFAHTLTRPRRRENEMGQTNFKHVDFPLAEFSSSISMVVASDVVVASDILVASDSKSLLPRIDSQISPVVQYLTSGIAKLAVPANSDSGFILPISHRQAMLLPEAHLWAGAEKLEMQ